MLPLQVSGVAIPRWYRGEEQVPWTPALMESGSSLSHTAPGIISRYPQSPTTSVSRRGERLIGTECKRGMRWTSLEAQLHSESWGRRVKERQREGESVCSSPLTLWPCQCPLVWHFDI